uniref:Chromosome 9 open reading frame 85 n=1 Tax=Cyprinus carpio carpio TaxID=630221 RepID=A0A9J8B8W3_CYPCA
STQWRPSPGQSTANLHAQKDGESSGCRFHRTSWCKWAPVEGRPAWTLFCSGTVDSRKGNIAHSKTGNVSRSRGQKHQNVTAFKNDKYGASEQVKKAKSKAHDGLCQHCKDVLEWKVKYNKYKPLTQPRKCVKCLQKTVKDAYHIICKPCALKLELCAKCGKKEEIVIPLDKKEEEEVEDSSQPNKGKIQKKKDKEEDDDEDFDDLGFSNDDGDSDS